MNTTLIYYYQNFKHTCYKNIIMEKNTKMRFPGACALDDWATETTYSRSSLINCTT